MNPNKYFEFEYNGESYVVPRKWLDEHDKQMREDAIEECIQDIEDSKSLFDNSTHWTMSEKGKLQNRLRRLKEQK